MPRYLQGMVLGKVYTPYGYAYLEKKLGTGGFCLVSPHLLSATFNEEMVADD